MRANPSRLGLAAILCLAAAPALAQTGVVIPRGYVAINGGYQGSTQSFTSNWTYPSNLETASITTAYSVKPAFLFDAGAGVRVWRNLTFGVAVSRYNHSNSADLTASVPHPFFYNQPRTYQGTASGNERTEIGVHVQAMWTFALAKRVQMGLFAGPTVFNVKQAFISAVNFAEAYPYDTLTYSGTTRQTQTASKAGVNMGIDMTILLAKQVGVGVLMRYSRASVVFKTPAGTSVSVNAGGAQLGAGLRLRF